MKKSTQPSPSIATKSREPRSLRALDTQVLTQIQGGNMGTKDHSV